MSDHSQQNKHKPQDLSSSYLAINFPHICLKKQFCQN